MLQRCLSFFLAVQKVGNLAHLRVHPDSSDNGCTGSISDTAAGENHITSVSESCSLINNQIRIFFRRNRFPCKSRFFDLQAGTLQKSCVSGNKISSLQSDDISGYELSGFYQLFFSVSQDFSMGCRQIFKSIQSFFCFTFLHHTHDGIDYDDDQDQNRLEKFLQFSFHTGNDKRYNCRKNQDENHNIFKLIQKTLKIRFLFLFTKFVFTVLCLHFLYLLFGESRRNVRGQNLNSLFGGLRMIFQIKSLLS